MSFLTCIVPVSPVRSAPSHRSEQVSQLLFGEQCELLEKSDDFIKIRILYDDYEGWSQSSQLEETDRDNSNELTGDWLNIVRINEQEMHIPFGCSLPRNGVIGGNMVQYKGNTLRIGSTLFSTDSIEKISALFLNTPYLWGGRSVFGIDCSGFSQLVFKCFGIRLLRDASQQVAQGSEVGSLEEVKSGDLAFFDNEQGRITHVGILLGGGRIIHAAGKVRIDPIDKSGIINSNTGKRSHQLRVIKRIVA